MFCKMDSTTVTGEVTHNMKAQVLHRKPKLNIKQRSHTGNPKMKC